MLLVNWALKKNVVCTADISLFCLISLLITVLDEYLSCYIETALYSFIQE